MSNHNTSDMIEAHLLKILEANEIIEIRRTEMAQLFNVVPSQINYVINTRFTVQRGYVVESKRGGGGYIRISKIKVTDARSYLAELAVAIGEELSERDAYAVVQNLYAQDLVSQKEGNLILSALSKTVLGISRLENQLRARILKSFLERLSYKKE
jgi:transcriptional regulator CtsR